MATLSSREAALERRKALTTAGKKAAERYTNAQNRVRTAADARATRTVSPPAAPPAASARPPADRSAPLPSLSTPVMTADSASRRPMSRPIANPSRELVLARREALSRRGKRADTSSDRTRSIPARSTASEASPAGASKPCGCQDRSAPANTPQSTTPTAPGSDSLSSGWASRNSRNGERRPGSKRASQHNPSRALVLARREALSKRGKSASTPSNTGSAAVARHGNPDLSSRELAQKVRELKSKVGSAGSCRNGGTRPCGPRKGQARIDAAADAHWKVGISETSTGQVVTGTQANRSPKTTGNEASTCRPITGTEYLGAEIFRTFCQSDPVVSQPAKVRVSATSQGNRVTGNEVGRSEKVTGDEPGTCKNVTGTEYISANQSASWCGTTPSTPRKVGHTATQGGRPVSGVMVGRSEKVTGDEAGSGQHLTGTQYVGEQDQAPGRAPTKVSSLHTLRGTGITGTHVGRHEHVTGDEPGSCRFITGDEYIGTQQYEGFCGTRPVPEAAKVGFSVTNKSQVVSGTRTGRSERVTGDEPGTCKAITGTPYAGLEQAGNWCNTEQTEAIRRRTPARRGTPGPQMTGIQPGIGGVMTGAERGACENVTGTPYIGIDQMGEACGSASAHDADFPQPLNQEPWQGFSVQSPARVAQTARERPGGVTGTSYEQGTRITGPFDMAGGKVTGTEQFRFDRRGDQLARRPLPPTSVMPPVPARPSTPDPEPQVERPLSRVTGEGNAAGLKITGDDWDRGKHVTGTEGPSARRRNPSRLGPMSAMPSIESKRNEAVPEPVSRVTGSSGNTAKGSLITVSGGARG